MNRRIPRVYRSPRMVDPVNLNPRIIEALYAEGLMLSDEVRAAFDLSRPDSGLTSDQLPQPVGRKLPDDAQIALSCEALRTTTRMMHAVAWLINHRAYFRNEISEFQLHRYGRIAANLPASAAERLARLPFELQELIRATERFYARLVRLDQHWRESLASAGDTPAIQRLRDRLARMVG